MQHDMNMKEGNKYSKEYIIKIENISGSIGLQINYDRVNRPGNDLQFFYGREN